MFPITTGAIHSIPALDTQPAGTIVTIDGQQIGVEFSEDRGKITLPAKWEDGSTPSQVTGDKIIGAQ